jgi:hypothetical protein
MDNHFLRVCSLASSSSSETPRSHHHHLYSRFRVLSIGLTPLYGALPLSWRIWSLSILRLEMFMRGTWKETWMLGDGLGG